MLYVCHSCRVYPSWSPGATAAPNWRGAATPRRLSVRPRAACCAARVPLRHRLLRLCLFAIAFLLLIYNYKLTGTRLIPDYFHKVYKQRISILFLVRSRTIHALSLEAVKGVIRYSLTVHRNFGTHCFQLSVIFASARQSAQRVSCWKTASGTLPDSPPWPFRAKNVCLHSL